MRSRPEPQRASKRVSVLQVSFVTAFLSPFTYSKKNVSVRTLRLATGRGQARCDGRENPLETLGFDEGIDMGIDLRAIYKLRIILSSIDSPPKWLQKTDSRSSYP